MTANDDKSCISYLNKLADEYNNTYCFIGKTTTIANYSFLLEKIETNPKSPKLKVVDRVRITKHKKVFSKGYIKNWSDDRVRITKHKTVFSKGYIKNWSKKYLLLILC